MVIGEKSEFSILQLSLLSLKSLLTCWTLFEWRTADMICAFVMPPLPTPPTFDHLNMSILRGINFVVPIARTDIQDFQNIKSLISFLGIAILNCSKNTVHVPFLVDFDPIVLGLLCFSCPVNSKLSPLLLQCTNCHVFKLISNICCSSSAHLSVTVRANLLNLSFHIREALLL